VNPVTHILHKIFVREFYRSNAGFFLLVIGVAGGFMRSYEHIALAEFFTSAPIVMLIPLSVWMLYLMKVIRFNLDVLQQDENEIVFSISLLPTIAQWTQLVSAVSMQLVPIIAYSIFLTIVALKNGMVPGALLSSCATFIIVCVAALRLYFSLLRPRLQDDVGWITNFLNTRVTRHYSFFFAEWIIRRQALVFIGTKVFSISVLYGIMQLYLYDEYDIRLLGMGTALAMSANVNLVWEMHQFDNHHLGITRNLPLHYIQRLGYFAISMVLLTLPEAGIIIKQFPAPLSALDLIYTMTFGWSILFAFNGFLYVRDRAQEQLMTMVFFAGFTMIILILFSVPIFLMGLLNLIAGLLLWHRYYYTFEYIGNK